MSTVKSGPTTLFSKDKETLLCRHIISNAEIGYGYSRADIIRLASDMAHFLGKIEDKLHLSESWLYGGFLKRHPELSTIKPQKLSKARANVTKDAIDTYFDQLSSVFDKCDL